MPKLLIGFMGSGKTSIARLLDPDFIDMDQLLEERLDMSISQYFAQYGEAAFRREESQLLAQLLEQDRLVSTGGGVVMSKENRKLLAQADQVIYLAADFDVIYERLSQDKDHQRPLFVDKTADEFRDLFHQRLPLYEEVASQTIQVSGKSPQEIVKEIK